METRKFFNLSFLFSFLIIGIYSCQEAGNNHATNLDNEQNFASAYEAPYFKEDNREAYLMTIGPKIKELMEEYANERNIPGISFGVTVDDKLVYSGSTGLANIEKNIKADDKTSFRIASMTKSFTAMAIMGLMEEGFLSLNDPAEKYIPELKSLQYLTKDSPKITIENLLTMTAGFPEDNPWGDRQLDETDEMLMELVKNELKFSNPPSYRFEYSNTGYALLGNIISRISGKPYGDYMKEEIFEPLGMNETYWELDSIPSDQLALGYRWEDEEWKLEPMLHHGSYGSMGGLITSIEDFSKYVSLHLSAWPPRNDIDNGPVKRSSLRAMQTPKNGSLAAKAKDYMGEDCPLIGGYGYGLGIRKDCHGMISVSHGGALPGFGSNYVFFPEYGIGLMAFCNLTYTTPWPLTKILKLIFEDGELEKRELPISEILQRRKEQISELIKNWDEDLGKEILAENFYMDFSRERRMKETAEVIEKAGKFLETGELRAQNQLRGSYDITTENGTVHVFFTLSPEKDPKVQQLEVWFN